MASMLVWPSDLVGCYETSAQKDRKDRSMPLNSASSRGQPPLQYKNEKFLDDTNDKASFLYIGV